VRSLLEDLANDDGPMRRAQRGMQRQLPKRFYKETSVGEGEAGFAVLLDGKPVRTPAQRALALPTRALAQAVAAEWAEQSETIDPANMPLTKLANVAIDRVEAERQAIVDEIAKYAGTDLVCYRASEPAGLAAAQRAAWDPVLDWAGDALGARFRCAEGMTHVAQSGEAIAAVRAEVAKFHSTFALAALASATALAGSALIALALARGKLSADVAWAAAHVDEDWNTARWGEDAEATARRAFRRAEFDAAAKILAMT
jgi:chaperone required for assembly of F1-ATPase